MNAAANPVKLRTVDLFCGCGGITLGFELHQGNITFETVLGSDIDAAALRVFNQNVPHGKRVPTGRLTDLSWFSHRAEVLLYFLVHYCVWADDEDLGRDLSGLGFNKFLSEMRALDEGFAREAEAIALTAAYQDAWTTVDAAVTSLALYRGILTKLGFRSLKAAALAPDDLPWTEEYRLFDAPPSAGRAATHTALRESAETLWDEQKERFTDSAGRKGRGQNRVVGGRMATLATFFDSKPVLSLREKWVAWRASRDSLRASFCLRVESVLDELYADGRSSRPQWLVPEYRLSCAAA